MWLIAVVLAACATYSRAQTLTLLPNIRTAAGTGVTGETTSVSPANTSKISFPGRAGFDASGNVYFGDFGNYIYKIDKAGNLSIVAGTGAVCASSTAACGDGGPATSAQFDDPYSLVVDRAGNIFIGDFLDNRVRKISAATGIITTVVGSGTGGTLSSTTPVLATTATIFHPIDLALDASDNIYFSDSQDNVIYKYYATGANAGKVGVLVNTSHTAGFSLDGTAAASALENQAVGLALDSAGNLFFADQDNNRVRELSATAGTVSSVVGNGLAGNLGDGGLAGVAELNDPRFLAFDSAGDLIISDSGNTVLRIVYAVNGTVTTTSTIATLAGTGASCSAATAACGDGGLAVNAQFGANGANGGGSTLVSYNAATGAVYVPDYVDNRLRVLVPSNVFPATAVASTATQTVGLEVTGGAFSITSITAAAGPGGAQEFTVGTVTGCTVNGVTINIVDTVCSVPITFKPSYPGLRTSSLKAVTSSGTFYFNVSGTGTSGEAALASSKITTFAGTGTAGYTASGPANTSLISGPRHSAIDNQGNLYFASSGNNVVRKVLASTGAISTVAGNATACATTTAACGDGAAATSANLNAPRGVAIDGAGNLYIADTSDNRIRKVSVSGTITTIAGTGTAGYTGDGGTATAATLSAPTDLAIDANGQLYIADSGNSVIRVMSLNGLTIYTAAGNGTFCATSTASCGDGGSALLANLNGARGIAVDANNNLIIADTSDNRIRLVSNSTGLISTVAGTGTAGYTGDTGAATSATFSAPTGIAVDAAGDYYIADSNNNVVRQVLSSSGAITTLAGTGTVCTAPATACGDGAAANAAKLASPQAVTLDGPGNLYVSDFTDNEVRQINVSSSSLAFASTIIGSTSADSPKTALLENIGNSSLTLTPPLTGSNPSIAAGFSESNSSTCPQLSTVSSPGALAAGASCTYLVNFTPVMTGSISGSLIETDNSLNTYAATQSIALSGIALQAPSQTVLTISANPVAYGTNLTFTATVTGAGPTPTGTVTFYNGATATGSGTINGSGVATLAYNSLPAGTDSITAVYTGDTNYTASTSNAVTETVGNSATVASTTALTSSVNPTTYGQSTTLTATVASTNSGATPTGTVTFYAPGAPTVVNLQSTAASTTYSQTLNLAAGTYSISILGNTNGGSYTAWNPANNPSTNLRWTDRYGIELCATCTPLVNDISGAPGTSTDTQALSNFQAATLFNQSTNNLIQGQPVNNPYTFTLTSPQSVSLYVPDGTFVNGAFTETSSFSDDTGGLSLAVTQLTAIGTGTLNASGVATLTTNSLPVGSDQIEAVYSGDNTYVASSSAVLNQAVNKANGADALTTSNASPTYGASVTLTDTVPTVLGVVPTGTVTFYNGGTAIGTGAVNGSGVATLTTGALPVGSDSITAVYGGDANYASATSNAVTETVAKANGADVLTSSNASPTYGTSITLTDTIPTINSVAPTGTVTFYNSSTIIGTGTVNASGVATLTTGSLPVGSDSITAIYGGDANYAAVTSNAITETVAKANGADALTSSNASPGYGTLITFTDTIPIANGVAPTGMVTFYNGSTAIGSGTVNSSGVATLATGSLPIGSDSITAVYGGDANYAAVTSNLVTETVSKASGADALTTSNASPTYGTSITLTDTIPVVNGVAPTGTVTFYDGSSVIGTGTVSASGIAALATGSLPVGSDSITAVYGGDSNYASVTSNAVTETVAKANGADVLTTSNASPAYGTSITLTDTIPVANSVAPTGTVTFYNGSTAIGTSTVNASGMATLATGSLPVGSESITAVYSGDNNYASVTSNAITETVGKANGADTLTSSPATPMYGDSVTFTDTVPTVNGVAPTGTVTFYDGSTVIGTGTLNAAGVATLVTGSLPVGNDSITAVYGGDANYASVTSNAITETVAKATGTDALTTSNASPSYGTPITLTDTIPTVNGVAPTGTVTFYDGSTVIGTGTVNSSGVATLANGALPVGTDSITAVYGGDANYASVTSNAVTETVGKASGVDTLTTSNAAPAYGTSVTFTDTIPTVNGVAPTGTVTFYNGSTAIGTGAVSASGVATITTGTLPIGTNAITAVYGGDGNYASVTSNAITETVGKAHGADTLTASSATPTYGTSITFTDIIPTVNGVTPTGTVTFYDGSTVIGTGTVNSSGVATLTTGSLPVGTDSITAVYSGDGSYASVTSNALTETVGKANGADTLTTSNASVAVGASVTFTDSIPTANGVAPTGTVTFYSGSAVVGTGTVSSTGVATLTTSTLPAGTNTISAVYGGDANYASVTSNSVAETVGTPDTLTVSNASPMFGSSITLTLTVPEMNGFVPTGTVTFYDNGVAIGTGTINASGVATFTTGSLPVGSQHMITAYSGDANYPSATSGPIDVTVVPATGPDMLTASNTAPTFGAGVTLTDTIPTVGGVAPTGTVTFYSNGVAIGMGTVNASGVATLTTGTLPVGADNLTAIYGGDGNYGSVTAGPLTANVSKAGGTGSDMLTTSNAAPTLGTAVTFTDTLPTINGVAPTGTVTFYSNGTAIGTGSVSSSGVATLITSALSLGTDTITTAYSGDGNYNAATSNSVTETVGKASGADTLTASATASMLGQPVTFTDTVPVVNGIAPTGSVTFYSGGAIIGTSMVNASGVATLTTGALPLGTDTITANYAGDANYVSATSNSVLVTVGKGDNMDTLTVSTPTSTFGQSVTLTDMVAPINGVEPTGIVTFYLGTKALGTGTLSASGVATLSTSALPVGSDSITATYGGDSNFAASISNAVSVAVGKATGADVLTSSNTSPTFGTSITLTDTLPVTNGIAPTGTVTFYAGTTVLGTGAVSASGAATLSSGSLPVGTATITAVYSGDANYNQSTSNAVTETVTALATTGSATLTTSNPSPVFGEPVTFTETIPIVNGIPPTGTVTFYIGTTVLGTSQVSSSGVATFTTSSIPTGTSDVTAVYSGDANYGGSASSAVTETVIDFSITATPANQTVSPGDSTSYTVSLAGLGVDFNQPIILSATGLPPGGSVVFSPPVLTPGTGTAPTTMTIITSPSARLERDGASGIGYALLLLPLLGLKKVRRKLRRLPTTLLYPSAAFLLLAATGSLTGCGGGYFGHAPNTYTITVTGTSSSLHHSTSVTLTVR